jgi:beta-mannosidase
MLAKNAHVNMLRIWGGGLIEKEAFYNRCDELDILVWQEFIQSSSGIENTSSDDPDFIAMMVHEAEQIIPRKRNHPSLAIWCGGNELSYTPDKPLDEHPLMTALKATVAPRSGSVLAAHLADRAAVSELAGEHRKRPDRAA